MAAFGYSQNANITFGHAPDCFGNSGICTFQSLGTNKSSANTSVTFNKENSELILKLDVTKIEESSKLHFMNNEIEEDTYLYSFDTDFILSNDLKTALNILDFNKIKKGIYLVKAIDDTLIMKLKLE